MFRHGQARRREVCPTIKAWLAGFGVRPWPIVATYHHADANTALESKGEPIGNMYLMIAAHAPAQNGVVITKTRQVFPRVPSLATEVWGFGS